MTKAYLLSTLSSNSSIGGLVMPSGRAAVPDTQCLISGRNEQGSRLPVSAPATPKSGLRVGHQLDDLRGRIRYRASDDDRVELIHGAQLHAGYIQAPRDELGILSATPAKPALELLPRRRLQEHQQRIGDEIA